LAVRSPYLNFWITTKDTSGKSLRAPGGTWPIAWNGRIIGWQGLVRVDGVAYEWQGQDGGPTFATTIEGSTILTPTTTMFTVAAGPVELTLTYLSPVEPSDWVRQSFPFSYLSVNASSTDGKSHQIQLYSDITGEPLSSNTGDGIKWSTTQTSKSLIHSMQRSVQLPFSERGDTPQDGTLYFATPAQSNLTWQTGSAVILRGQFMANGTLLNTRDNAFRNIQNGNDWPVLGFSLDLGNITQSPAPFLVSVGLVREPAIRTVSTGGLESRSLYFWTKYNAVEQAVRLGLLLLPRFPSPGTNDLINRSTTS
jgi:hypothetical protein